MTEKVPEPIVVSGKSRKPWSERVILRGRRRGSPFGRGVGTNVMKKALSQISKSPFTRGIKKAKLPRHFHQPTFAMYNGRTDPVEHVSQFK